MKTIYKYEMTARQKECVVQMPQGAVILTIDTQFDTLCIWALVDTTAPDELREFLIIGTGHDADLPNHCKYINTVQVQAGAFIFHIFEVLEEGA
jgi:hypothetical protein